MQVLLENLHTKKIENFNCFKLKNLKKTNVSTNIRFCFFQNPQFQS